MVIDKKDMNYLTEFLTLSEYDMILMVFGYGLFAFFTIWNLITASKSINKCILYRGKSGYGKFYFKNRKL